jgi:hypothetical protein
MDQYATPCKQGANFPNNVSNVTQVIVNNMTKIFKLSHKLKLNGANMKIWKKVPTTLCEQ